MVVLEQDKQSVPFLDLKAQYRAIQVEILPAILTILESAAYAGGPAVEKFEAEFAAFCHCRQAIGVGSGTDALWLALLALGVGPGDEVITTANTFIATAEAISYAGATPVFVDVCEDTFNMDPSLLVEAITPRTRAIIPVHLYGQMADMDPIREIARKHDLYVIEDASQAHGAEYKGHPAGSLGDIGCFSFYPGKNLGAYGEAGAIVTNDVALATRMRRLRDHGQARKYYHEDIGWNARMDGIQGAILSVKLRHLPAWNERRRQVAQAYTALLEGLDELCLPLEAGYGRHVYHIFCVRTPRREALLNWLNERDIHCAIHYPVPLHLQQAYRELDLREGSFPVTERCAREILSLPMYAELSDNQVHKVAAEIKAFFAA